MLAFLGVRRPGVPGESNLFVFRDTNTPACGPSAVAAFLGVVVLQLAEVSAEHKILGCSEPSSSYSSIFFRNMLWCRIDACQQGGLQ